MRRLSSVARTTGGRSALGLMAGLSALLWASTSAAAGFRIGDDERHLDVGALIQAWATVTERSAPDGGVEHELYLRRMRLMFSGQTEDMIRFFVETDSPNFGKGGSYEVATFIQDAFFEFNLDPALQVDVGMLLVPFSHHGMQGATSLLGVDYHGSLLRYPAGSNKVWRDAGVIVRGLLFGSHLDYRVGVFNGVHGDGALQDAEDDSGTAWLQAEDPRNPSDWPRATVRLTFNVFDAEGGPGAAGFFYDGLYLAEGDYGLRSPKTVLSIGASMDWQRDVNVQWAAPVAGAARGERDRSDYLALAGDVFWDLPMGADDEMSLNGQVNGYYYDHGERGADAYYAGLGPAAVGTSYSGVGLMSEAGFRYRRLQPVAGFDWFKAKDRIGSQGDYVSVFGGFNVWLRGHGASLKVQAGSTKADGGPARLSGALQAQLLF